MFVKIVEWEVVKENGMVKERQAPPIEHVYDVNHYVLFPEKLDPNLHKLNDVVKDEKTDVNDEVEIENNVIKNNDMNKHIVPNSGKMCLSLEFNKDGPPGWDRTISFPFSNDKKVVEIFIMNSNGKTVQKYSY
jgi:hypothetical protein